jgi:hypothetical protein
MVEHADDWREPIVLARPSLAVTVLLLSGEEERLPSTLSVHATCADRSSVSSGPP